MQRLKNNKLTIVFIIVLVIFIYNKFFTSNNDVSDVVLDNNQVLVGNEFLDYLAKVKSIEIDDKLFKSTAWTNLVDFSRPLPEVSPGKDDLFNSSIQISLPQATPKTKSR